MISKNKLLWLKYFFLIFYFLYLPEILIVLGIPIRSQVLVGIAFGWIVLKIAASKIFNKEINMYWNKNLTYLFSTIIISALYFMVIAVINSQDPRIIQNTFSLFQVIVIIYLLNRLIKSRDNTDDALAILFQLASFQGIISIIMLFLPLMREFALNLYYLGEEANTFISAMRIFGISGEYTFFTPIYHGLLMSVIVYLYLFKNKNYTLHLPLIFIVTILNGRTGVIIFLICLVFMLICYLFLHISKLYKLMFMVFGISFLVFLVISFTQQFLPSTYRWLMASVEEVSDLLLRGEGTGTFAVLENMFILPKSWDLLIGKGFRLYGNSMGLPHSDIGYVNDLFMGGIIYCTILYLGELKYIFSINRKRTSFSSLIFSLILLITLGFANFKGEASRGGLIFIGVIILKYLIIDRETTEA